VNGTNRATEVLKDSAVIIAIATGLLYLWGTASYYSGIVASGIPFDFAPAMSTEGLLFRGAFEGVFLLPIPALVWILIDQCHDGSCSQFFATLPQRQFPVVVSVYLAFLFYSIIWVLLMVHLEPQFAFVHRLAGRVVPPVSNVVKAVKISDKGNSSKYEGLFFITKKGNKLVFSDKAYSYHGDHMLVIVNEDEIKELILTPHGDGQK